MGTPPENRASEAGRDAKGRFSPGSSGNPGGIPRAALAARRAFAERVESALAVVDELMQDGESWNAREAGARIVLERALGKVSAPAELPTDSPTPSPGDASPRALLERTLSLLARSVASKESQLEEGLPLSEAQCASLREDAHTLSLLAKEERELSKAAPGANLSDAALKAEVLKALPVEELRAELERRNG